MNQLVSDMKKRCEEADLILVGLGEEFQFDWDILQQKKRYQEIEKEMEDKEEYIWIIPFLQKMMIEETADVKLNQAYGNLKNILGDKNYFIISTMIDDSVYQHDLKKNRIVTPLGGFQSMQCDNNCMGEISKVDEQAYENVKKYFRKELPLKELKEPVCKQCGQKKRFNQLGVTKYAQEGYLSQWELYTKWLQGTVNKKLCVIELGVGLEMPSIIRWPFEKIVLYNQKSYLYRIHSSLYQLDEKVKERGIGIKEKPVDFLANGFVK